MNLKVIFIDTLFDNLQERLAIIGESEDVKEILPILISQLDNRDSQEYLLAKNELDIKISPWLETTPEILDFILVAPDGRIVYASSLFREAQVLGRELPDPEGRAFSEGKKGTYFSNIFESPFGGEKFEMLITLPVFDSSNEFLGVAAFEIGVTEIYDILTERTELGESGESYLVDSTFTMVSPSRFQEGLALKQEVDTVNSRNCFTLSNLQEGGKAPLAEAFPDYRGIPVFGTSNHIPRTNWCLLSEIDEAEAFQRVDDLKNLTFVFIGIALILVLLASFYAARIITKPIRNLTETVDKISGGDNKSQIDQKLKESKDEIGTFARSFEVMRQKVESARKDLEKKVVARTKELEAKSKELEKGKREAERFSDSAVGRELKMIELKKKIKMLEGKPEKKTK